MYLLGCFTALLRILLVILGIRWCCWSSPRALLEIFGMFWESLTSFFCILWKFSESSGDLMSSYLSIFFESSGILLIFDTFSRIICWSIGELRVSTSIQKIANSREATVVRAKMPDSNSKHQVNLSGLEWFTGRRTFPKLERSIWKPIWMA